MLSEQNIADISIGVSSRVGGYNLGSLEPLEGRETLVVFDCGLEEVDNFLVLAVLRTIAGNVESGVAGCMLAELVGPEAGVVLLEGDPVGVHVVKEVEATKGLKEIADIGAIVGWDDSTVGESIGGVGRWDWVVLASQVAVLSVAAIAEIGPAAGGQYIIDLVHVESHTGRGESRYRWEGIDLASHRLCRCSRIP